jgi:hypothetical protein
MVVIHYCSKLREFTTAVNPGPIFFFNEKKILPHANKKYRIHHTSVFP